MGTGEGRAPPGGAGHGFVRTSSSVFRLSVGTKGKDETPMRIGKLGRGIVASVGLLIAGGLTFGAELPEGYHLELAVDGLTEPSSLAMTPAGQILITERTTGMLRMVEGGELASAAVCTVGVNATGEGGLLGVAVDPDFGRNGFIYLYYTSSASNRNKVTRFVLSGGTCSSALDIFSDLGAGASFLRNGGGIAFGSDGKLYVATGDVENPGSAQDDALLTGKVLRANADGSVPDDNPTAGSFVYAKGVRDGKGVVVGSNGQVYLADAGATSDSTEDEANAVPAAGNLGWDHTSGNSGGSYDDPLISWASPIGAAGLAFYAGNAFPDQAADGRDSDDDALGPDHRPGVAKTDDNASGICVGSDNFDQPCTSDLDCPPRVNFFTENAYCEMRDEAAEHCDGAATGDDDCDALGAAGIDEPDESFLNNLFLAADSGNEIVRIVTTGDDLDEFSSSMTFLDASALADCPTAYTDVATGNDGFLYLVARNSGGNAGGLYRVVRDLAPGPREVSRPGSPFPVKVGKAGGDDVWVYWEDLGFDALQPRDDGTDPALPEREYTVWVGDLGTFDSHVVADGLGATAGDEVNGGMRRAQVASGAGNKYFLVSGRGDNLEGTLGINSDGVERAGYTVTDLCDTIGYHGAPDFTMWTCGQDFELPNELEHLESLYEYRGHPILLDLSAIWCGPCRSEADVLETLYQDYKDRGVQVLTVLSDEYDSIIDWVGRPGPAECRDWSDREDPNPDHTFPCFGDPNVESGDTQKAWPKYNKHNAYPSNVILDSGLRVVYSDAGFGESAIRSVLDKLVGTMDTCLP